MIVRISVLVIILLIAKRTVLDTKTLTSSAIRVVYVISLPLQMTLAELVYFMVVLRRRQTDTDMSLGVNCGRPEHKHSCHTAPVYLDSPNPNPGAPFSSKKAVFAHIRTQSRYYLHTWSLRVIQTLPQAWMHICIHVYVCFYAYMGSAPNWGVCNRARPQSLHNALDRICITRRLLRQPSPLQR